MAPRERAKKFGGRRIDAAIDNLVQLGFTKGTVYKTISKLLDVYGGEDGWVFIEEASYKLVIDTILEEQDEKRAQKEAAATPSEEVAVPPEVDKMMKEENAAAGKKASRVSQQFEAGSSSGSTCKNSSAPPRRRPPCHGWLSESEDDLEEDCSRLSIIKSWSGRRKRSSG